MPSKLQYPIVGIQHRAVAESGRRFAICQQLDMVVGVHVEMGERPATEGDRKRQNILRAAVITGIPVGPRARSRRAIVGDLDDPPSCSCRFIPASAGNTPHGQAQRQPFSVHPRIRGEHSSSRKDRRFSGGSSPHPRGTQPGPKQLRGRRRFIPASAGNTGRPNSRFSRIAVHPRIRGEHVDAVNTLHRRAGSSPHPRGTLFGLPFRYTQFRFIPASAGNTVRTV